MANVRDYGFIDPGNTSATALAAGGVYTGTKYDVTPYGSVTVTCAVDVPSAARGLQVQQSSDGTTWDVVRAVTVSPTVAATETDPGTPPAVLSVNVVARWLRVVFTNGSTAQGSFRLQTRLHLAGASTPITPLGGGVDGAQDAATVRAVLYGVTATGEFAPVQVTADGYVKTDNDQVVEGLRELIELAKGISIQLADISGLGVL